MDIPLKPGAIIMTSKYNKIEFFLCPSLYKHCGIYFGTGLGTYLLQNNINYNDKCALSDDIEYVIHNNGKSTVPVTLENFMKSRTEISIYYYKSYNYLESDYVMKLAAQMSCLYLNTIFSFTRMGIYCFELIINSYRIADESFRPKMFKILNYNFYNSQSITNDYHFYPIYVKYKNKCSFIRY